MTAAPNIHVHHSCHQQIASKTIGAKTECLFDPSVKIEIDSVGPAKTCFEISDQAGYRKVRRKVNKAVCVGAGTTELTCILQVSIVAIFTMCEYKPTQVLGLATYK